jgi:hypothetical protein
MEMEMSPREMKARPVIVEASRMIVSVCNDKVACLAQSLIIIGM